MGLVERHGNLITSIQTEKIAELGKLVEFINKSAQRRIGWTCYYLYRQKNYVFSAEDIQKYNPTLHGTQIEKILDRNIVPQWRDKGMKLERKGNDLVIDRNQKDKLIVQCITGWIESPSRRKSRDIEEDILILLDESPYSNNELARILGVDKSQISRKIRYLREKKSVKAADLPASRGHQYWLTNCNNCPWSCTKTECRNNSITDLTEICKQRYGLDLDPSYFGQIENNQTLVHLVDLFKDVPNQNFIEKEKRVFLNRVFHDIIDKIGRKNIEIADHEYWIKTNKGRQQPLNRIYWSFIHVDIELISYRNL